MKPALGFVSWAVVCGAFTCTAALADQTKLHPVETYTVVYKQSGVGQGTMTMHSREFGYRRAEIADVVVTVGAVKLPMKQRTVIEGDRAISIDEDEGSAEVTTDPSFAKMVRAMAAGSDGLVTIMKIVWDAAPTGKTKTLAGETCGEFVSADKKQTYCATTDGILLYINQGTPRTRFERTATEVRRGDGGADDAFKIPASVTMTDGNAEQ